MPPETVRRQTWVWTFLSRTFFAWTLLASAGIQVAPVQERSPGPGAALLGVHPLPPGTMFNLAGQRVDHAHPGQVVLVVREHGRVERTVQRD